MRYASHVSDSGPHLAHEKTSVPSTIWVTSDSASCWVNSAVQQDKSLYLAMMMRVRAVDRSVLSSAVVQMPEGRVAAEEPIATAKKRRHPEGRERVGSIRDQCSATNRETHSLQAA
jgi:hypothetical protein